jgi:ribosomal protection tetracycline resistance protein
MSRATLNLGILAHVDAGKTTLTERLLFAAGVIDQVGSVDEGTTQTDTLELERQRGITIKSAVVSFRIDDVTVNLIDTPGHPDFIAEVERALSVLDGAVLVVSAVEGVQPQTRILMRALQRLQVPTLLFVNKVDRRGATDERVLDEISRRLMASPVPMGRVRDLGTRTARFEPWNEDDPATAARLADALADHDETVSDAYLAGDAGESMPWLLGELANQTAQSVAHPVFFGSALTGAGTDEMMRGIARLLPSARGDVAAPLFGRVFKVQRRPAGQKVAFARLFSGTLRVRDRVRFGTAGTERTVTGIEVFVDGSTERRMAVSAGEIAMISGLSEVRIGDEIGRPCAAVRRPVSAMGDTTLTSSARRTERGQRISSAPSTEFAAPALDTVVEPVDRRQRGALRTALDVLAEQDPLIAVRQDDGREEITVSLYGEVQKEVIGATLASEFGVEVGFRDSTTICVERPVGTGSAVERLKEATNPFVATVGLRIDPAPAGSGVEFRIDVELGSMPLAFFKAVEDTVRRTLEQGLYGWAVIDCVVSMTHSGYVAKHSIGHARFTKSISSTGEDYRKLTPLVLMAALRQAGTVVCEPIHAFRLDAPADSVGSLVPALTRLRAIPLTQTIDGDSAIVAGEVPVARVNELRQRLPVLTRGEGVLETAFERYERVRGRYPMRRRTGPNPLDRAEYLMRMARYGDSSAAASRYAAGSRSNAEVQPGEQK